MRKLVFATGKKRYATQTRAVVYGLLQIIVLGLISVALASTTMREATEANNQCIHCHVELFIDGMRQPYIHSPFSERQCTVCHLASGTEPEEIIQQRDTDLTGSIVNQKDLWRKLKSYKTTTSPVFGQLIKISSLEMSTPYRFRIVVSLPGENDGREIHKGLWLGLQLDELDEFSRARPLDVSAGLPTTIADYVRTATLYREGDVIFLSWEATQQLHGWVEIQEMEGLNLTDLAPYFGFSDSRIENQDQHPPLKNSEELTISVCDQCHPEATLGASHPVRIYGGGDVKIPDELPTVEGMLTCVTCHDPHGTEGKMLIRETIKTKLCVACHFNFKGTSKSTTFTD